MKYSPLPLIAALILCVALPAQAQALRVYEHPSLGFAFTAPDGWKTVAHPEDDLIYEVADSKTGIHVLLWYTSTEQSALKYLNKMADMKDLVVATEPVHKKINQREAWVLNVSGTIAKAPIQTLLAVIPSGRSLIHPAENALYIVQIWCPAPDYPGNSRAMEKILDSVKVMNTIIFRQRQCCKEYQSAGPQLSF